MGEKENNIPKCTYTQEYYNYETKKPETFECDQLSLGNKKLCLFHDEDYLKDSNHPENKEILIKKLNDRIDSSIFNNKPLFCIGCHLPDIKIDKKFNQFVYFNHCKFQYTIFMDATFSAVANFMDATFSAEANFSIATFSAEAYFGGATFSAGANFNSATFSAGADFMDATFSGNAIFADATFSAEANFSIATFSAEAYFGGATFSAGAAFGATFSGNAYFGGATFSAGADFGATFSGRADFPSATFSAGANFRDATFSAVANFLYVKFFDNVHFSGKFDDIVYFNYVTFENPIKVIFEVEDMSKTSFMNTDITGVRFSDKTKWGGEGNFQVIEEVWLEEDCKKSVDKSRSRLGGVLSVYRNLRENYEFRRRYDEAGKFFIREMELKRKYREVKSSASSSTDYKIKKNNIFRRNISLTGIYYNLSRYGEDLLRPTLAGIVIVLLATFFFVCQSNPSLAPTFSSNSIATKPNNNTSHVSNTAKPSSTIGGTAAIPSSSFIGLAQVGNGTHWLKAGERSLADFLPLLPSGSDIKIGLTDYLIKIVGGAVTFGLIAIALRRRFERKYTH